MGDMYDKRIPYRRFKIGNMQELFFNILVRHGVGDISVLLQVYKSFELYIYLDVFFDFGHY